MVKTVKKAKIAKEIKENLIPFSSCIPFNIYRTIYHFNEYRFRNNNIKKDLIELMKEAHNYVLYAQKELDCSFDDIAESGRTCEFLRLYTSCMLDIFFNTGLKYVFLELRKPKLNYEEEYKLNRNSQKFLLEDDIDIAHDVQIREESNTLKDKYNTNKEDKKEKAKAINTIRKYLYSNKFTLKGTYLDTEHVTFFDFNIHDSLKLIFPNEIEISNNSSYIKIKDVEELEKKLKNLLQVEVKIVTE